jgi:hypothetical protein
MDKKVGRNEVVWIRNEFESSGDLSRFSQVIAKKCAIPATDSFIRFRAWGCAWLGISGVNDDRISNRNLDNCSASLN